MHEPSVPGFHCDMSRIDPVEVDRLKARVVLSSVVGRDVAWDRKKTNVQRQDFWGCCPFHGENTPSFHVDDKKGRYYCFGCGAAGDIISWLTQFQRLSFRQAIEELGGQTVELNDDQRRQREEDIAALKAREEQRREQEDLERLKRTRTAEGIWKDCKPITGTLAERYLMLRGIDVPPGGWPDTIGFHRGLEHELSAEWEGDRKVSMGPVFPCLVARVDDLAGKIIAVWRIYLDPATGRKAAVDNPKVGLGPAKGGAVRLGGVGRVIGVTEGIETGFAAWAILGFKHPVWPCLSTSGMVACEFPFPVERLIIFPDGDRKSKRDHGVFVPVRHGAGMRAAIELKERATSEGLSAAIQTEPREGQDYLDIWNSMKAAGLL